MRTRFLHLRLVGVWAVLCGLAVPGFAGQDSDNNTAGGVSAAVELRHRVVVPQILYFRLGDTSASVVSKLTFNASPGGRPAGNGQSYSGGLPVPLGDGSPIAASGGGGLTVQLEANVGTVNLSYDLSDPQGLSDGAGNFIPFDEVDVSSADPSGLPTPPLANAGNGGAISVAINGNLHGGRVIRRTTQWVYRYQNSQVVRAGTYEGRVRYTASAP